MTLLSKAFIHSSFKDIDLTCNNAFEGGGWLLVRYSSFGSTPSWYRAVDGLRGADVYGYPGLGEYSIYFRDLLKPESELLFVVGKYSSTVPAVRFPSCRHCRDIQTLDDNDLESDQQWRPI